MSRADILKQIADAHYQLADLYQQLASDTVAASASRPAAASPPAAAPATQPEGHLAVCPKHHVPFTEGQYGPYCKQATDDPAWGKQKGDRLWCRITPQNAAEYLRIKAAAA
jgi:hypothetical protein